MALRVRKFPHILHIRVAILAWASRFAMVVGAEASIIEVCAGCRYRSVTDAVQADREGDTIRIYAGIYSVRNLVIDKPLVIEGVSEPVLDGGGQGKILRVVARS